jgi:hypothetical protein
VDATDLPETLVHFAAPDAYRGIFSHGMRPARQIFEDAGLPADEVQRLTTAPRPDFVELPPHPKWGRVRVAHNRPLITGSQTTLAKCLKLGDSTLAQFCSLLNERVFFWADESESAGYQANMAAAGSYDRISFRTTTLLRLAADVVQVSPYNSGSIPRTPVVRGPATWTDLAEASPKLKVKELVIVGAIDGLATAATSVRRITPGEQDRRIWAGGPWPDPVDG